MTSAASRRSQNESMPFISDAATRGAARRRAQWERYNGNPSALTVGGAARRRAATRGARRAACRRAQ